MGRLQIRVELSSFLHVIRSLENEKIRTVIPNIQYALYASRDGDTHSQDDPKIIEKDVTHFFSLSRGEEWQGHEGI